MMMCDFQFLIIVCPSWVGRPSVVQVNFSVLRRQENKDSASNVNNSTSDLFCRLLLCQCNSVFLSPSSIWTSHYGGSKKSYLPKQKTPPQHSSIFRTYPHGAFLTLCKTGQPEHFRWQFRTIIALHSGRKNITNHKPLHLYAIPQPLSLVILCAYTKPNMSCGCVDLLYARCLTVSLASVCTL
jgi:hypothetical protein